ncbi:hypothetical protein ACLBR5_25810 [Escherichia coli]
MMRPDRFVAATAIPQTLGNTLNKLAYGDNAVAPALMPTFLSKKVA